jgi:hypothetical protein
VAATPYPPVTVGPAPVPAPPKRHRLRTFSLVVALAAIVGGGVAVAVQQFGAGSPGASSAPSSMPSEQGSPGTVPASGQRYNDPAGFSIYLPKGWQRSVSIKSTDGLQQIDYSPDQGEHLVRIAVDTSPDYDDPYLHEVELEQQLKRQLADYERVSIQRQVYRDRQGSRLEYTWTEQAQVSRPRGAYRAVDLMYIAQSGVEYAICMASPVEDWATTRKQFETVLQGWREGGVSQ